MLSRRGSSQTALALRKSREVVVGSLKLRALSDAHSLVVTKLTPRLPLELLEYVVECYFEGFVPGSLRLIHDHVRVIRLCNRAFNEIALRHVFNSVIVTTSAVWNAIARALLRKSEEGVKRGQSRGFAWVR